MWGKFFLVMIQFGINVQLKIFDPYVLSLNLMSQII
jgi:hypothetical protein